MKKPDFSGIIRLNIGTMRFELMTPSTPRKCATKLRYVPSTDLKRKIIYHVAETVSSF